ncbi:MAG: VWA domain-containing protein [Planctomycetota bacterium]|nr:VWA domain-containing protein [Planctomycetota bacterium]
MDIQFGHLNQLNWLWLVAAVGAAVTAAWVYRRHALRRFATSDLLARLLPKNRSRRRFFRTATALAAMAFLVIGLVDIRWGKTWKEVPQKGIEVMFVLDVSRSMLADDVTPTRLDRAKQQIKDMVDEMTGDRVGLILFAGEAKQHVPLTRHYSDFKQSLDEVGPYNVQRGGSRLGDAIGLAADSFLGKSNDHKAIVILTDGEDQESNPLEIAKQIHQQQGTRIFTIGLGDMEKGSRIPMGQTASGRRFLEHEGEQVWSRLNGAILEQVALETDGAFVPAGTKQVDMADIYHRYVASVEQQDFETAKINAYTPRYQYFVGAALALLLLEIFWPWGTRRNRPRQNQQTGFTKSQSNQQESSQRKAA